MKKIKLFDDVDRYLHDLAELLPRDEEEFLKDKNSQYSISMIMLNLITSCIDIGSGIVTLKMLGYPSSYKDVFSKLQREKIISYELAKKMQDLAGLRNLLAHEYGEVNLELLYAQASEMDFIEEFLQKTMKYFK